MLFLFNLNGAPALSSNLFPLALNYLNVCPVQSNYFAKNDVNVFKQNYFKECNICHENAFRNNFTPCFVLSF